MYVVNVLYCFLFEPNFSIACHQTLECGIWRRDLYDCTTTMVRLKIMADLRLVNHRYATHCSVITAVGKTRRGVGAGVVDHWVKLGDWELGDHVTELCCFDSK